MKPDERTSLADECPKCGAESYRGGHCFKCGTYRSAKRRNPTDVEEMDAADFMEKGFGTQISDLPQTEDDVDANLQRIAECRNARRSKEKSSGRVVIIEEKRSSEASLLIQAVVEPLGSTPEGQRVCAVVPVWRAITEYLNKDWANAHKIPWRKWEEIIAAAFEQDGYEVILTPPSGDHGRDVIAIKRGIASVRIIDSVKAYSPGHLVTHDDVRALAGVLLGDQNASKGIVTTTSDFAPGIKSDPYLSPLVPFRLELMNGQLLRNWLACLTKGK